MTEDHDQREAAAAPAQDPGGPGRDDLPSAATVRSGPDPGGAAPSTPAAKGTGRRSGPEGRTRRRRRWPWVVFVLVVVALAVASRWNLDYYALQPGTAKSVQQFITVPAAKSHPVRHPVYLTDVEIGRVSALNYLFYKTQGDTDLEPLEAVTGGTPPSELGAQGDLEMSQAESAATTAALRRLGYTVTATPSGAVIAGTFPGTPAAGVLHVGDVITAVDGTATQTARSLTSTLARHRSGQTVTLTVRRRGTGAPAPVAVTLERTAVDLGGGHTVTVDLGIEPEDQVDFDDPFPVSIKVTDIGGPSAGLAMTLGVIDALTPGSLSGNRKVAATGTMDSQGDVGDVGGVPQKTVAVENAGASIFLVPPQEYEAAMSKDRPGLQIFAVSTLDQALAVLAAHGGAALPAGGTGLQRAAG